MTPELRQAIAELGKGEYRDGSSTKAGWLYQPMGDFFPELKDVPVHCAEAVRHTFQIIEKCGPHKGTLIDIGCSTGYYLAGLGRRYGVAFGIEKDLRAVRVAHMLGMNVMAAPDGSNVVGTEAAGMAAGGKGFEPIEVDLVSPVTVLALNVHMWWSKQGIAEKQMKQLSGFADRVFFQTAGMSSAGRYRVNSFRNMNDERIYLSEWFDSIELLDTTTLHGGVRHLWLLRKGHREDSDNRLHQ